MSFVAAVTICGTQGLDRIILFTDSGLLNNIGQVI